jgi:hypothetical protein
MQLKQKLYTVPKGFSLLHSYELRVFNRNLIYFNVRYW